MRTNLACSISRLRGGWGYSTVQRVHYRQTRSHGTEGRKGASEDNKLMIVQIFPKVRILEVSVKAFRISGSVSGSRLKAVFGYTPFRVQIGSHLINRVNSTKYLGMHLDNKLNWDTHISKLESKHSCYSGKFYRIREYLSTNELKMIYFSLVYSHLQYAIGAWGSATKLVYTD